MKKRVIAMVMSICLLVSVLPSMTMQVRGEETLKTEVKQEEIATVEDMPNLPSNTKIIDWKTRGSALDAFLFDTNWQAAPGRKFQTLYEDTTYGGYLIPAFYGETRTVEIPEKQEAIVWSGIMLQASLLGIDKDEDIKDGESYLDSMLKFYWEGDKIFTNFPDQSTDPTVYKDFWYLLIANQNFYRLADQYPDWEPKAGLAGGLTISQIQKQVADSLCEMVDVLGGENCDFDCQAFDFSTMSAVKGGWRQPDAAAGTANILYYAYKLFGQEKYLTYSKYCMEYLEDLSENPYYENMLIDASYIAAMMNAEIGTNYDISKYLNWICGKDSNVRNWGGINYSQNGIDVYGLSGEARGDRQYAFFFNSVYPMTSILPTAKYDPSYARTAGKWALNIANACRYFLPSEWPAKNQSNPEYVGTVEGDVLAYEGFKKYSQKGSDGPNITEDGIPFMLTGDAMMNATSGWNAGATVTNLGVYGSVYTGFLGALVEKTNVENILKLDCNKTDYYQDSMYPTYLYYNPYDEVKNVEIDLGNEKHDIYDSVTGKYLMKNVSGKQSFRMLADSARVIVLTPANSTAQIKNGETTYINETLVAHSKAERLPERGTELVSSIQISGKDLLSTRKEAVQYKAAVLPENVEDSRVSWKITNLDGSETVAARLDKNGVLYALENGTVKITATAMDGSGVYGEKIVTIENQDSYNLLEGKPATATTIGDSNLPGCAVDGNSETRWGSVSGAPQDSNLTVNLISPSEISTIYIEFDEGAFPVDFALQYSMDGQNWTNMKEIKNNTSPKYNVSFEPVTAKYLRIQAEKTTNEEWAFSVYEFEAYGNSSEECVNLVLGKTAEATTTSSENYPGYAIDGDLSTRWSSEKYAPQNSSFTVDLGYTSSMKGAQIYFESAFPTDFKLQVSDDKEIWRDVKSITDNNEKYVMCEFDESVTGRYVRIQAEKLKLADWGFSVFEFSVYGNVVPYTVTFNTDGGNTVDSMNVKPQAAYGTLPVPTKSGYEFDGWYTSLTGGEKVNSNTVVTQSHTLYARWTQKIVESKEKQELKTLLDNSKTLKESSYTKTSWASYQIIYDWALEALQNKESQDADYVLMKSYLQTAINGLVKIVVPKPVIKNGWVKKVTYTYYYKNNKLVKSSWIKSGKKTYRTDSKGRKVTSKWVTVGKYKYYLKKDGNLAKSTWVTYKKNKYRVDSKGRMLKSKWTTVSKKKYYLKKDGKMAKSAWVTYKKNKYRVDSKGRMIKSKWIKVSGKSYYLSKSGIVKRK